jgi:CRP-like cAMP-binding protein
MPNHRFSADRSFDPEVIRCMSAAFDGVCSALGLSLNTQRGRDIVAKRVIEFAGLGRHKPEQLRDAVLASFGGSSTSATNGTTKPNKGAPKGSVDCVPGNRVLASLSPFDLALLTPFLTNIQLRGSQQDVLSLDYAYFPSEGLLSLLAMTPEGQTIEIASTGRGGIVCPPLQTGFGDGVIVAEGPIRAARIAMTQLEQVVSGSETLSRVMAGCREALLLQLRQNLICAGLHPAEQRLSRWLLEAVDRIGSQNIEITQEGVAQRLGLRRTTVTLLAGQLQEMGAIDWSPSRVDVLSRARLEAASCSCYRALRERVRKVPVTLPGW